MKAAEFWERAHAHWDARRDPLEDEGIQSWLQAHPELLEEFVVVRASILDLDEARSAVNEAPAALAAVQTTATATRPGMLQAGLGRRRWVGAAIAASLVFTVLLFEARHPDPSSELIPNDASGLVRELDVGTSRVLSFDMRVTTSWPSHEVVTHATAEGRQRERSLTARSNTITPSLMTAHWRVASNHSFQP